MRGHADLVKWLCSISWENTLTVPLVLVCPFARPPFVHGRDDNIWTTTIEIPWREETMWFYTCHSMDQMGCHDRFHDCDLRKNLTVPIKRTGDRLKRVKAMSRAMFLGLRESLSRVLRSIESSSASRADQHSLSLFNISDLLNIVMDYLLSPPNTREPMRQTEPVALPLLRSFTDGHFRQGSTDGFDSWAALLGRGNHCAERIWST